MITYFLIGINVLISVLAFSDSEIMDKFLLKPYLMKGSNNWYRLISHGFIHADFGHLAFNMLTLYFFGPYIEKYIMGSTEYLMFYLSALLIPALIIRNKYEFNFNYAACGASGAISAVIFGVVLFKPWTTVYIYFAIPIYFIVFAVLYLLYSWFRRNNHSYTAHDVHLYGSLFGISYILIFHKEAFRIFLNQISNPPF